MGLRYDATGHIVAAIDELNCCFAEPKPRERKTIKTIATKSSFDAIYAIFSADSTSLRYLLSRFRAIGTATDSRTSACSSGKSDICFLGLRVCLRQQKFCFAVFSGRSERMINSLPTPSSLSLRQWANLHWPGAESWQVFNHPQERLISKRFGFLLDSARLPTRNWWHCANGTWEDRKFHSTGT